jgi:hypothetical protein
MHGAAFSARAPGAAAQELGHDALGGVAAGIPGGRKKGGWRGIEKMKMAGIDAECAVFIARNFESGDEGEY